MFEFAIFPDDAAGPSAIFVALEDAIDFGVHRYGANRFSIKHWPAVASAHDLTVLQGPRSRRVPS